MLAGLTGALRLAPREAIRLGATGKLLWQDRGIRVPCGGKLTNFDLLICLDFAQAVARSLVRSHFPRARTVLAAACGLSGAEAHWRVLLASYCVVAMPKPRTFRASSTGQVPNRCTLPTAPCPSTTPLSPTRPAGVMEARARSRTGHHGWKHHSSAPPSCSSLCSGTV